MRRSAVGYSMVAGLMAVAAIAGLAIAASSCAGEDECEFDAVTRDTGGVGLIDCGIAPFEDPSEVDECAVDAYQAGQTFRAIYEQEDRGLEAIVHAAGGTYHLVRLSGDGQRITRADCAGATFIQEDGRRTVACDRPGPFSAACE
jgi:hypothetical protein